MFKMTAIKKLIVWLLYFIFKKIFDQIVLFKPVHIYLKKVYLSSMFSLVIKSVIKTTLQYTFSQQAVFDCQVMN